MSSRCSKKFRIFALLAATLCSLGGSTTFASEIQVTRSALSHCHRGHATTVSLPFSDPAFDSKYELAVYSGSSKRIEDVVGRLMSQGHRPVVVVNAGFHTGAANTPVSFFKSSFFGNQNPHNSARSPRACLVYDRARKKFEIVQSTRDEFDQMTQLQDAEVFCGGPEVLREGKNTLSEQLCREQFTPACRPDGSDPGLGPNVNNPRTAACMTSQGDLKLFVFSSSVRRCGATLPNMTQYLASMGCTAGINLDGGGSTKLYVRRSPSEALLWQLGNEPSRRNPVWVVVLEK